MSRPRIIPVLLLDRRRRLVKTVQFGVRTYIGDPFNVIRLFNEKEVDEIVVLDIDATVDNKPSDIGFLSELASECFMPLSYGGGLKSMNVCNELARAGIEKFIIGSALNDTNFLKEMTSSFGSQAVVACIDYRQSDGGKTFIRSGQKQASDSVIDHVRRAEASNVGEIILQSIDQDGMRAGMDLPMISEISKSVRVPLVALGGAGDVADLKPAIEAGASAVASGSAFSFIGRLRAVLISYPEFDDQRLKF
jgi:imidazole glycerol-phosphate synthase subunit HisF